MNKQDASRGSLDLDASDDELSKQAADLTLAPSQAAQHRDGIGLALSGGGFRAALFALGTLWRLSDCGWLKKLTHITSVSGGSITSAYLGMQWRSLSFDTEGVARNFEAVIAQPVERFCGLRVDVPSIIKGLLTPGMTIGDFVARTYARRLYRYNSGKFATLQDLPLPGEGPLFIIYATNLQTGVSVRFAREHIYDYRLGRLPNPDISLAVAVGASSAFPPMLSPVRLQTDPTLWRGTPSNPPTKIRELRSRMILSDGGVYDNMGIEAIFARSGTVLVSDAGAPAELVESPWTNWLGQLARVRAIMMEQTRALRRRMVMGNLNASPPICHGALWRIGTRIDDFCLQDAMIRDNEITAAQKFVRTRLNPCTPTEAGRLINWGYALCDAAMRTRVDPSIPRGSWPRPSHPLCERS
jgi:NTE family protein